MVQKAFSKNYKIAQKKAKLPGYRKGKVPLDQVRRLYQAEVIESTTMGLVEELYLKALNQEPNLNALPGPKIDFKSPVQENKSWGFSVIFEVPPVINVDKDFVPTFSLPPIQIKEEEINQSIKNIQKAEATFEVVKEHRAIEWGDFVEIEFKNEDSSQNKVWNIEMTKKPEDPGLLNIIKSIVGTFPNKTEKVSLNMLMEPPTGMALPPDTPSQKKIDLSLTIGNIKKQVLPELNDSFAQKMGHKNIDNMKEVLHNLLKQKKQQEQKKDLRKEVLKQLTAKYPLPFLPEVTLEAQERAIMLAWTEQMAGASLSTEDIKKQMDKNKKSFQKQARFMVHYSYLLYDLAHKLNIKVSSKEIQNYLKTSGVKKPKQRSEYMRVGEFLTQEKIISYLIDKALKNSVAISG